MKQLYFRFFSIFISIASAQAVLAQCSPGKNLFTLDWDHHEFGRRPFSGVTADQSYQFGGKNNTLTIGYAGVATQLENPYHTVPTGSFGSAGENVQFSGNGTITFTFTSQVENFEFSLFDVDGSEAVSIDARDAANSSKTITLSTAGTTNLALNNNPGTNASASSNATLVSATDATNAPNNTLNVSITGPVKTVTITLTNASTEEIWLSDLRGCTPIYNAPTNYLSITRPNTGEAAYFIAVDFNNFYIVNLATGNATLLFQDNSFTAMNTMAYDPYKSIIYYTSNALTTANRIIKKYDVKTGTISIFVADVNSIGIPTNTEGVGSGGATFYDGSLYFSPDPHTNNIDSLGDVVWRIDIDGAGNALPAVEVKSFNNGAGADIHNWGDMGVINGKLFDFNVDNGSDYTAQRFNMNTGINDLFHFGPNAPYQMAVGWDNKMYSIGSEIREFDTLSGVLPAMGSGLTMSGAWTAGHTAYDASESFKSLADYGNFSPAKFEDSRFVIQGNHVITPDLFLGDIGPDAESSNPGISDGPEDDGVVQSSLPIYSGDGTYSVPVRVFNNSGVTATVCGFMDFNDDGDFTDAGEKICVSVPSSAIVQTISLNFSGFDLPASLVSLRIRVSTDASKIQTIFDGAPDGEVEDYRLSLFFMLPVTIIDFSATWFENTKGKISWLAGNETSVKTYILQRSENGADFYDIYSMEIKPNNVRPGTPHTYIDNVPVKGKNFYRLKIIENSNKISYSKIRLLTTEEKNDNVSVFPNPVKRGLYLNIDYPGNKTITAFYVVNKLGQKVVTGNQFDNSKIATTGLPAGLYYLVVEFTDGKKKSTKFLISE